MKNLTELTGQELLQLQDFLDRSDLCMYSLPLRQQLWYLIHGILTDGHVYVDRWPSPKNICSLHTSREFAKDTDFDVATFYQIGDAFDTSSFEAFMESMASERQWTGHRSLYGNYAQLHMVEVIQKVLEPHGKLDKYGAYYMYTGLEKQNIDRYRKRLEELSVHLPSELVPDVLRASDVPKLIEDWPYGPPEVVPRFYHWLLRTVPSVGLRTRNDNELVVWALSYSCGALANLFVDQKFRGRGLSEYLWLAIGLKLADFSPLQPYFNITPGNIPSERSSKKAFWLDCKKGDKLVTWFFYYNRKQFPEK